MDSICNNCEYCTHTNKEEKEIRVSMIDFKHNFSILRGSQCKLTGCFMTDVINCEGFKQKKSDEVVASFNPSVENLSKIGKRTPNEVIEWIEENYDILKGVCYYCEVDKCLKSNKENISFFYDVYHGVIEIKGL